MIPIIPAIMPAGIDDLEDKIQAVHHVVDVVQIDIMDGKFVPGKTWPYPLRGDAARDLMPEGLPFWDTLDYELDLMVSRPEDTFEFWRSFGPAYMVIHYESVVDWDALLRHVEESRDLISFGLSFDNTTDVALIEDKLEHFDYVQCMGIEQIGFQGQPFHDEVLDTITYLRNAYPDLMITVDGSVNFDTIQDLCEAGAQRFVAGSAVYNHDNPAYQVEELARLVQ